MPDDPKYFIATHRLGFRRWREADLPLALSLWGNAEVARLIGGPFTPQVVAERLRREMELQDSLGVQYWPIFLRAADQFAGCCGLRPYRQENGVYEIGFHLLPAVWNKGLAQEAAGAVIDFAFRSIAANGLFAGHHPENAASRHVLEKLGFLYTHEELYPPTARMHRCYFLPAPGRNSADTCIRGPSG